MGKNFRRSTSSASRSSNSTTSTVDAADDGANAAESQPVAAEDVTEEKLVELEEHKKVLVAEIKRYRKELAAAQTERDDAKNMLENYQRLWSKFVKS